MQLTIGYPRLIHSNLIAIQSDLQSIVIFTIDGELIGWIHGHTKTITFAQGYDAHYEMLCKESDLAPLITHEEYVTSYFVINGSISHRNWGIKTEFIYPSLPPKPITIDTEDQY